MTKNVRNYPEILFNGVCVSCSRHWKCPKANQRLHLKSCGAYKLHKSSNLYKKQKETEQNDKAN